MISAKRVKTSVRMRNAVLACGLLALGVLGLPSAASAAPGPAWSISVASSPTNFIPEDPGSLIYTDNMYTIHVENVGSKDTDGRPIAIRDFLPAGLSVNASSIVPPFHTSDDAETQYPCEAGPPVTCIIPTVVHPGEELTVDLPIITEAGLPASVINQVTVAGGGAGTVSASTETSISETPAPFAVQSLESSIADEAGSEETRAGSHPYQLNLSGLFDTKKFREEEFPWVYPSESPRDITANLPAGLVVNPQATPVRCTESELELEECPDSSAVGIIHFTISQFGFVSYGVPGGIYNMVPPPGVPASFGFDVSGFGVFVHLQGRIRSDGDYGISSDTRNITTIGSVSGISADLWGNPSDPSHDHRRGKCASTLSARGITSETCPVPHSKVPLITMPSACQGPLTTSIEADSWQNPGHYVSASSETTNAAGDPVGVTGCDKLSFSPAAEAKLSTEQAGTGTGLDYDVNFPNNGLEDEEALAESNSQKAVVTLPEGLTINPSVGEGLGYCTPAQYKKETVDSIEGEGCPTDSKVGTLHLTTPLVDEALDGSVYLAQQDNPETSEPGAENPFDTDIALYFVLKNPILGVIVKQPLKVEADPKTGQLVATLDNIPQLPFDHFEFHFREGARAALVSPSACGKYTTVAKFYPSSAPNSPKTVESSFEITKGVNGGPCPSGGVPPFNPGFEAGAENNNAGSFSPFDMRLIRHDGEQDMTKFSVTLPPGELGSLSGVAKCPDADIAAAKGKTGRQEEQSPSCPANSLVGHTIAGAGVGDSLTYVPGYVYLGGPYHGDPLSVIAITPGVAGPFDAGTVVVQEALTLNPKTAEVEVDGANSDPIPHILKGIPLKVRELRVDVNRQDFTLNPTSCAEEKVRGTIFGSNLNLFDPSDDDPVGLGARYQAADCQALPYKPRLALNLKGGTRRGAHPGLIANYRPRPGDANTEGLVVRLPHSAFLDQAHIKTICTRVQFAAGAGNGADCPQGARYGYVKAWTPLLEEPLEGPVFLRSSNHKLPDMVFALHGLVDIEVATRIDSSHGGIRATVEEAPDAPISRVLLRMQGAKKGLIVNSKTLCASTNRANALATGHNGKRSTTHPVMRAQCGKGHKQRHKRHRRR